MAHLGFQSDDIIDVQPTVKDVSAQLNEFSKIADKNEQLGDKNGRQKILFFIYFFGECEQSKDGRNLLLLDNQGKYCMDDVIRPMSLYKHTYVVVIQDAKFDKFQEQRGPPRAKDEYFDQENQHSLIYINLHKDADLNYPNQTLS